MTTKKIIIDYTDEDMDDSKYSTPNKVMDRCENCNGTTNTIYGLFCKPRDERKPAVQTAFGQKAGKIKVLQLARNDTTD